MQETSKQYDAVINTCKSLFIKKMTDYGSAWRILRLPSLTDQIFIKAQRIRSLQQNAVRKVDEGEVSEFIGIINYCIMALIQLEKGIVEQPDLSTAEATALYEEKVAITKKLMEDKNHDYGEAWRDMRVSSLTDLILQKLLRVKQIEDNRGKTIVSEGIDANYQDMINYAVFALIHINEKVRVQFDGWPAIVFSGWPNVSYGTYGARVVAIENFISDNGKYRILLAPDPDDHPWPEAIRVGSGAKTIALLEDVPIWFELWRQINSFPPNYYQPNKMDKNSDKEK